MSAVDRLAVKLAPPQAEPESIMVAAFVPSEVGARIAVPGGEPIDQLHITLCFLGKTDTVSPEALAKVPAILEAVTYAAQPIPVALVGTGTFPASEHSEGKVPFYARVDAPALEQLRRVLAAAFTAEGVPYSDAFEYRPHVTLDYLPEGATPPEVSIDEAWLVDGLTLVIGKGRTQVPFGGVDRLGVKLARAYVAPHIRITPRGERVSVEAYWRQYRGGVMASPAPDTEKIVRVTKVVDTREWDDNVEPPKPIPGSGSPRTCDRCNRSHEVHVFVQLDNGHEACIGSGCARKDEMGMVRKAVASATTVNRLEHQLERARERLGVAQGARAEVMAMPLPAVEDHGRREGLGTEWVMGDARVWQHDEGPISKERYSTLVDVWRVNRIREMGSEEAHRPAAVVEDLEKRLARARRSLVKADS